MTKKRFTSFAFLVVSGLFVFALAPTGAVAVPPEPPLGTSPNVTVIDHVPGSVAGLAFKGKYAYASGWDGVTVLDISEAAAPEPVGFLPLPHFENEDVEVCGNTLLVTNDRGTRDYGAVLHVVDVSDPALPSLVSSTPVGLTGEGRGAGHTAAFVKKDCSLVWLDGGDLVEVIDLKDPAAPKSLGKFESVASDSDAFRVTHDTELDPNGTLWQTGGGGAAGYKLTKNPLKPKLVASTGKLAVNPAPKYNDFIFHNSERSGNTLLVTEEDYVDTDETPPGSCRGQGRFQTWSLKNIRSGKITPLDTWETELNGMVAGGADDSKAPVTANCSSHWFDTKDGIAAIGWYEQGVRFLDTRNPSKIRQVGYYLPANGSVWAAYWSPTDPKGEIVYSADVYRGIDVLRIKGGGKGSAAKPAPTVRAPIQDSWFGVTPFSITADESPSAVFGWACPFLGRREL